MDDGLVIAQTQRGVARQDRFDDRLLDADPLAFEAVRIPLEGRAAGTAGDEDRDLRQPRWQRFYWWAPAWQPPGTWPWWR